MKVTVSFSYLNLDGGGFCFATQFAEESKGDEHETVLLLHCLKGIVRMGAIGEGCHSSEREYIFADSLEERAKLLEVLLRSW